MVPPQAWRSNYRKCHRKGVPVGPPSVIYATGSVCWLHRNNGCSLLCQNPGKPGAATFRTPALVYSLLSFDHPGRMLLVVLTFTATHNVFVAPGLVQDSEASQDAHS
jgi:hypothetical protein